MYPLFSLVPMKTATLTTRVLMSDIDRINQLVGSTRLLKSRNDVVKAALRLYLDSLDCQQKSPTNQR